jgi:hypothetical protein
MAFDGARLVCPAAGGREQQDRCMPAGTNTRRATLAGSDRVKVCTWAYSTSNRAMGSAASRDASFDDTPPDVRPELMSTSLLDAYAHPTVVTFLLERALVLRPLMDDGT